MRIEENYIKHGYFWLPENKDIKIPGILSISDGGRAELEIIGSFGEKMVLIMMKCMMICI